MMTDNLSEEVAAADATLALVEALLDDLWEARQLLSRIDHFIDVYAPPTAATHAARTRDWMYLQCRLGMGDSDEQALAALAAHRTQVRR